MIRVLIGDSIYLFRDGLRSIVSSCIDMRIIREADTSEQLLDMLKHTDADVLITDLMMHQAGVNGLELVRRLKLIRHRLPLVVILQEPQPEYALLLLRAGCSGCLTFGSSSEDLINAIRSASGEKRYISDTLKCTILPLIANKHQGPSYKLSSREYEILIRLAKGETTKEVAQELCLSSKTISTYRSRALTKLGLRSNTDLIRYAIRHNLIHA